MKNLQNRTRVLYVRVSDDEFRHLRELCQKQGARNISDLVRSSIETMSRARETKFEDEVTHRLLQLEGALNRLGETVEQITRGRVGK